MVFSQCMSYEATSSRLSHFGSLTHEDILFFRNVLDSPAAVITEATDLAQYNVDWMKKYRITHLLFHNPRCVDLIYYVHGWTCYIMFL